MLEELRSMRSRELCGALCSWSCVLCSSGELVECFCPQNPLELHGRLLFMEERNPRTTVASV